MSGQEPAQQPRRGARVAQVDDIAGRQQAADADAVDPPGAGAVAAQRAGVEEIVDPRPYAVGTIAETFKAFPNIGPILPAMGYSPMQREELEQTIRATPADVVVIGTPIDLGRIIELDKPSVRVRYELSEVGEPTLEGVLREWLEL